ncbi:MAG: hypothetical protein K8R68_01535 [Bacteroidales bacterium]|nr:hypothetical protein [Bacteroidales bacterium]
MTNREKLKNLIDQLPEERINLIEPFLMNFVNGNKQDIPTGNLGLKKPFNRESLYDHILANRY